MPSVCFYFQVHQPYRVKRFSFFDSSKEANYFDEDLNRLVVEKVAEKCYLPTNQLMLDLIERYQGEFRIAYSITGVAIEQMERYAPRALESFQKLAGTGCVEFLGETYYHSLASLYDKAEFQRQVTQHSQLIAQYFDTVPSVFRNTEFVYNDQIGQWAADAGYRAVLAEGPDDVLDWRSPNYLYAVPGRGTPLLLKNYSLSDDIAFRFSNQGWREFPLTTEKYARWVHGVSGGGDLVNLFMDYETFGEHQWDTTGIFEFMEHLPGAILQHPDWSFCTPSEAAARYQPVAELSYPRLTSWADTDRDLTAWCGNRMQAKALRALYDLGPLVRAARNPELTEVWRKLQTSDHFYYMCTKWFEDGDVHAYFSPFDSPYDAFISFQNVLRHLTKLLADSTVENVTPHVDTVEAAFEPLAAIH